MPGFDNGSETFTPDTQAPLLIAPVGQLFTVCGWAKQEILNRAAGGPTKYAYLEQYFDKARTIDVNGSVTEIEAGLLSPYGEFFPTRPGPAALLTRDDGTAPIGQATVHVIKLQLDVNHDGEMDTSFAGPDNTSPDRPFVFWINNDNDVGSYAGDLGHDEAPFPGIPGYVNCLDTMKVWCQRDLEDWARLWVCGVPALADGNWQVTLSWRNISSGTPAINLIKAVESNGGGTGYLTSPTTAAAQIQGGSTGMGYKYPKVSPTSPLTLPADLFSASGNKYFLFEGAGVGRGELVVTISQNGQTVAETSAWLDLHDVKDFYERMVLSESSSGAISTWSSAVERIEPASSSALSTDGETLVLVHGINSGLTRLEHRERHRFKRLYWAGFHGRFASVKWPCIISLLPSLLHLMCLTSVRQEHTRPVLR